MWLVSLVVTATKHCTIDPHPEWGTVKGAYVNALICFPELHGAKRLAKMYATEGDRQWRFRHFRACQKVTPTSFRNNPEYQEYYAEAKKDGYSLVYHFYCNENKGGACCDAASFAACD